MKKYLIIYSLLILVYVTITGAAGVLKIPHIDLSKSEFMVACGESDLAFGPVDSAFVALVGKGKNLRESSYRITDKPIDAAVKVICAENHLPSDFPTLLASIKARGEVDVFSSYDPNYSVLMTKPGWSPMGFVGWVCLHAIFAAAIFALGLLIHAALKIK